jgi:hypothetical protein
VLGLGDDPELDEGLIVRLIRGDEENVVGVFPGRLVVTVDGDRGVVRAADLRAGTGDQGRVAVVLLLPAVADQPRRTVVLGRYIVDLLRCERGAQRAGRGVAEAAVGHTTAAIAPIPTLPGTEIITRLRRAGLGPAALDWIRSLPLLAPFGGRLPPLGASFGSYLRRCVRCLRRRRRPLATAFSGSRSSRTPPLMGSVRSRRRESGGATTLAR